MTLVISGLNDSKSGAWCAYPEEKVSSDEQSKTKMKVSSDEQSKTEKKVSSDEQSKTKKKVSSDEQSKTKKKVSSDEQCKTEKKISKWGGYCGTFLNFLDIKKSPTKFQWDDLCIFKVQKLDKICPRNWKIALFIII